MAEENKITSKKNDIDNREFLINTEIEAKNIEEVILGILAINRQDDLDIKNKMNFERQPIKVIVDSYGGYCYDGMTLVNVIATSKTPVHTYCYGKAMSMGLTIYSVGHKRFAHKRATFMQHQLSGVSIGKLTDMVQSAKEDVKLQDMLDDVLLENSDIKKSKILDLRERKVDWYFTGEEALEFGLVDELI